VVEDAFFVLLDGPLVAYRFVAIAADALGHLPGLFTIDVLARLGTGAEFGSDFG